MRRSALLCLVAFSFALEVPATAQDFDAAKARIQKKAKDRRDNFQADLRRVEQARRIAAQAEDAASLCATAIEREEWDIARNSCMESANLGSSRGQFLYASMLHKGLGVNKSEPLALHYFVQSTRSNKLNNDAHFYAAQLLISGPPEFRDVNRGYAVLNECRTYCRLLRQEAATQYTRAITVGAVPTGDPKPVISAVIHSNRIEQSIAKIMEDARKEGRSLSIKQGRYHIGLKLLIAPAYSGDDQTFRIEDCIVKESTGDAILDDLVCSNPSFSGKPPIGKDGKPTRQVVEYSTDFCVATCDLAVPQVDFGNRLGVAITEEAYNRQVSVIVMQVVEGSEAERIGIRPYDTIIGINGIRFDSVDRLTSALKAIRPNAEYKLQIRRGGVAGYLIELSAKYSNGKPPA